MNYENILFIKNEKEELKLKLPLVKPFGKMLFSYNYSADKFSWSYRAKRYSKIINEIVQEINATK